MVRRHPDTQRFLPVAGIYTTCSRKLVRRSRLPCDVQRGGIFAYLAGLVDGDGYFKATRSYRTPRIVHPYFGTVVGVQQLWPSDAVSLFASTFAGRVKEPRKSATGRLIARCEIYGAKAESAARHLLPFLLLKKGQALLLLSFAQLRSHRRGRPPFGDDTCDRVEKEMETLWRALSSLNDGSRKFGAPLDVENGQIGYHDLSPAALGWSQEQQFAYLAGIIDSDGNLRVERKRVPGMISPYYRINIRCTQVVPSRAVQLLAETFGGRASTVLSKRPECRDLVSWSLHDKAAAAAVEALLPYLRVKGIEAQLLLELRGLKAHGKGGLTSWTHRTRWQRPIPMQKRCYSDAQVAQFERIHRMVQRLHSGGLRIDEPRANQMDPGGGAKHGRDTSS